MARIFEDTNWKMIEHLNLSTGGIGEVEEGITHLTCRCIAIELLDSVE
jgi:hypothetical protein